MIGLVGFFAFIAGVLLGMSHKSTAVHERNAHTLDEVNRLGGILLPLVGLPKITYTTVTGQDIKLPEGKTVAGLVQELVRVAQKYHRQREG
jgi:hypothetical protein